MQYKGGGRNVYSENNDSDSLIFYNLGTSRTQAFDIFLIS